MLNYFFRLFFKAIATPIVLKQVVQENDDTFTFKFEAPQNIKWKSGAYAHFLASDIEKGSSFKYNLVREISIMSHPNEDFLGLTTRIRNNASDFKQALRKLKIGDKIQLFGIVSHIQVPERNKPVVFVSMGVGVATFRPLIKELLSGTEIPEITNINIERSGKFVYQNELKELPIDKIQNVFITSRKELYENIDKTLANKENVYYIIGSKQFNKELGDYLTTNNVDKKSIRFDKQ